MKTTGLALAAIAVTGAFCGDNNAARSANKIPDKIPSMGHYKWKDVTPNPKPLWGNTYIGMTTEPASWGVGLAPWDVIQPIKEVCGLCDCVTTLEAPTLTVRDRGSLPVEGNLTIAVEGHFGASVEAGSRDSLVDALAGALRGFYDPIKTEFVPYGQRDVNEALTALNYEPMFIYPAGVVIKVNGPTTTKAKPAFLHVRILNGDLRHGPARLCRQIKNQSTSIIDAFNNLYHDVLHVRRVNCLNNR